ncbi:MAG: hydrogenase [Methanobacterium sp.]|jgi:energy-converting hydrogenase A subunit K|nr:hydrogenase [Methanobacterium sp.]
MENKEKDTLFLMALAAFGAVLASTLATFLQLIIVIPLTLAVFLIMILTFFLYKKKAIHWSEKLETVAMIIVLISIIISFIYLFKPA